MCHMTLEYWLLSPKRGIFPVCFCFWVIFFLCAHGMHQYYPHRTIGPRCSTGHGPMWWFWSHGGVANPHQWSLFCISFAKVCEFNGGGAMGIKGLCLPFWIILILFAMVWKVEFVLPGRFHPAVVAGFLLQSLLAKFPEIEPIILLLALTVCRAIPDNGEKRNGYDLTLCGNGLSCWFSCWDGCCVLVANGCQCSYW